jgi:hypothetical protein
MTEERLPVGARVTGEVTEHASWGLVLRLADGRTAVADRLYVADLPPKPNWPEFPSIGSQVEGIVQGYTPNGQLRLSLRESDTRAQRP